MKPLLYPILSFAILASIIFYWLNLPPAPVQSVTLTWDTSIVNDDMVVINIIQKVAENPQTYTLVKAYSPAPNNGRYEITDPIYGTYAEVVCFHHTQECHSPPMQFIK